MASFLEGSLKKAVAKGFKGKLLKGIVRKVVASAVNNQGDIVPTGIRDYPFEGIRENFSAYYKAQAGIPDTDVSILIILGLTTTTPDKDDKIYINGTWYQVRKILEIDPAGASAKVQAFSIPLP